VRYVIYFMVGIGYTGQWQGNHPEEEYGVLEFVLDVTCWPIIAGAAIADLQTNRLDEIPN
jgi:hypothetical protein